MPCGSNGATNEHEYPGTSWGAPRRRTTRPPHDRNPSLFTASWPGSPGNRRPRRTGGFHFRRASAPLPVGRTVFEIAASLCQRFAQTPPQPPHPRVPPHRHPGSPPLKVRKVSIPRKEGTATSTGPAQTRISLLLPQKKQLSATSQSACLTETPAFPAG
jgi:hypothetical protein